MNRIIDRAVIVLGYRHVTHAVVCIVGAVVVDRLAFDAVLDDGAASVRSQGRLLGQIDHLHIIGCRREEGAELLSESGRREYEILPRFRALLLRGSFSRSCRHRESHNSGRRQGNPFLTVFAHKIFLLEMVPAGSCPECPIQDRRQIKPAEIVSAPPSLRPLR